MDNQNLENLVFNQKSQMEAFSKLKNSLIDFVNKGNNYVDKMICSCSGQKKLVLSPDVVLAMTGDRIKNDLEFVKMLKKGFISNCKSGEENSFSVDIWQFKEKIFYPTFYKALYQFGIISDSVKKSKNDLLLGVAEDGKVVMSNRNELFRMAESQPPKFIEKIMAETFLDIGLIYNSGNAMFQDYIKTGNMTGGEVDMQTQNIHCKKCRNNDSPLQVEFNRRRVAYGLPNEFLIGIVIPLPLLLADSFLLADFEYLKDIHIFSPTGMLIYEPKANSTLPNAIYDFQMGEKKFFNTFAKKDCNGEMSRGDFFGPAY